MQGCYLFLLFSQFIVPGDYKVEPSNQELFEGKNILITGGTGYLGRTLAEEILVYNPKTITLLSRDEVKLFNSQKFFKNNPKIKNVLGDVRDFNCLFRHTKGVDLVIHTAALKRMDALENNVEESIKTNILGPVNVFNACVTNKVTRTIFISTDKACSPVNIYGACKFVSEKVFTNYDTKNIDTIFTVVRFGNILESTGSVIPIFLEKIKNGEDITLTDPKMTRFIISKNEAVEFIFDAIRYGVGGEIFVKDLPALNVKDLIEVLKEKYRANSQVKIIGLRPGEKIHEVLINEVELVRTYAFNHMRVITPCLTEWLENLRDKNKEPIYMTRGNLLKEGAKDYSSERAVVSKNELKEILNLLL